MNAPPVSSRQSSTERALRAALVEEAASAGLKLVSIDERISFGRKSSAAGFAATALFGGTHRPDRFEIFRFRHGAGLEWIYVQPYGRAGQLGGGEHHVTVRGTLEQPLEVRAGSWFAETMELRLTLATFAALSVVLLPLAWFLAFRLPRAHFTPVSSLATRLNEEPRLRRALDRLNFAWPAGRSWVYPPWLVQLHAAGHVSSQLIVKSAFYGWRFAGGTLSTRVGFARVVALVAALQLPRVAREAQRPLQPPEFGDWLRPKASEPSGTNANAPIGADS